jgi:hypothetical protein
MVIFVFYFCAQTNQKTVGRNVSGHICYIWYHQKAAFFACICSQIPAETDSSNRLQAVVDALKEARERHRVDTEPEAEAPAGSSLAAGSCPPPSTTEETDVIKDSRTQSYDWWN